MKKKELPLVHFLLMFSLGYVYMFVFSATLPEIAKHFSISATTAQLTMTVYLSGFALSQLIYAPIANAFGRIKALYFGSFLAILGTLLTLLFYYLQDYTAFLIARLLMSLGACVGTVLAFTMIADVYTPKERRSRISYLTLTFAVMTNVAIFIGGWVMKFFGVEGVFYFLLLFSGLVLFNIYNLPETAKEIHIKHLYPKRFLKNYYVAIKKPQLWLFGIVVGCIAASIYSFSTLAPFIAMNVLKLSPTSYSNWVLLTSLGLLLGPLCSRILMPFVSSFRMIVSFNLLSLLFIGIILYLFSIGYANVFVLFIGTTLYYFAASAIFPNGSVLAIRDAVDTASSSSVFAFIYIGMSFVSLLVTSLLHEEKIIEIPLNFLAFMAFIFVISIVARFLKCEKRYEK